MKPTGKTIQIYLPDGNPRGVKIAEITSRTISAILVPRSKLDDMSNRPELDNVGIYVLFGDEDEIPVAYIGEAENCYTRLKQHNKDESKEFWTHAVVFISKTQFFTKTHIKFLEWLSIAVATKTNRYPLKNGNTPSKPHISEAVEADLYDNFETIQVLCSTLGYTIFDEIKKPQSKELITCKGKDALATGEYTEDGVVVFAGSTCNMEETKTAGSWLINLRAKLVESGTLSIKKNVLVFDKDYVFASPSAAAGAILGRRANGWIEWKYKDGKTLDEVKRQN